jgi:hypothetical protein
MAIAQTRRSRVSRRLSERGNGCFGGIAMRRAAVGVIVTVTMLLCWAGIVDGQSAGNQMARSTVSQPTTLQPLRPLTPQGAQIPQPMGNFWGGMPNMLGNMQQGAGGRTTGTLNRSIFRGLSLPMAQQNQGATQAGALSVTTSGRFLRENRAPGSFVGADARDVQASLGTAGAADAGTAASAGAVPLLRSPSLPLSSVQGAPPPPQRPTASPGRAAMYEPRLKVGFDVPLPAEQQVQAQLTNLLRSCPHLHQTSPIEVLLEGRTATLRGTVASERDRILAQQLILFEPGISRVKNELTVRPAEPQTSSPPMQPR